LNGNAPPELLKAAPYATDARRPFQVKGERPYALRHMFMVSNQLNPHEDGMVLKFVVAGRLTGVLVSQRAWLIGVQRALTADEVVDTLELVVDTLVVDGGATAVVDNVVGDLVVDGEATGVVDLELVTLVVVGEATGVVDLVVEMAGGVVLTLVVVLGVVVALVLVVVARVALGARTELELDLVELVFFVVDLVVDFLVVDRLTGVVGFLLVGFTDLVG